MHRTQIYLDEAMEAELAALAKERGVSKSALIREGVEIVLSKRSRKSAYDALVDLQKVWKEVPEFDVGKLRKSKRRMKRIYGGDVKI